MIRSTNTFLVIYFLFLTLPVILIAQDEKAVFGIPVKFENPTDIEGEEYMSFINSYTENRSKTKPWLVICDREGVETYNDANGLTKSGKKLSFKDWFYVVEEKGAFIRIVKLGKEPRILEILKGTYVENFGWIQKSKMLLWTSGLRSPRTKIYVKSLILYTVEAAAEVIQNSENAIKAKNFPDRNSSSIIDLTLYSYFYILKKENDMYLLASENVMQTPGPEGMNYKRIITGWVEVNKQADWNTRLAFEHNYEPAAYDERKSSPSLQFKCYKDPENAVLQALSNSGSSSAIVTAKDDPVIADPKLLASSNNRRYIGTKLRMPALSSQENYYYTGVLGTLGNENSGSNWEPIIKREIAQIEYNRSNYDILFLVEATTAMRPFKDEIKNAITSIKQDFIGGSNKRFAIAFYRDVKFGSETTFLDITPLNDNIDELINKIDNIPFIDDDYDSYSALFNALHKSAAKVNFVKDRTNIVYVIGKNPDFRGEPTLKLQCIEDGCDELVSTEKLADQLSKLRAHLVFIQPSLQQNGTNALKEQCEDLMLEVSKGNFTFYKSIAGIFKTLKPGINIPNPAIVNKGEYFSSISGGSTLALYHCPIQGSLLTVKEFVTNIRTPLNEIKETQSDIIKSLNDIISGKGINDVHASEFAPAVLDIIMKICEKANVPIDKESIRKISSKKVNFYVKAYMPKKISGAIHELCKPVLFFPENELKDYLDDLQQITALQNEPDDILRTRLKEALMSLYYKYAGQKARKDTDLSDLIEMLAGEGFKLKEIPNHNFVLNQLDNPRVKIETIRNFIDALSLKYYNMENMRKDNSYEFKFSSELNNQVSRQTYYWIPLSDTF